MVDAVGYVNVILFNVFNFWLRGITFNRLCKSVELQSGQRECLCIDSLIVLPPYTCLVLFWVCFLSAVVRAFYCCAI